MLKRLSGLVASCALVAATFGMMTATATAARIDDRERWCRYGSVDGRQGLTSAHETRKTIVCFAERWPVSLGTVYYILERESGFTGFRAQNPTSGACGLFQHLPSYWPGRVAALNRMVPGVNAGPSCFNGRSNIAVTIRMMHAYGYGAWSTAP